MKTQQAPDAILARFREVTQLPGVGKYRTEVLHGIGIHTVEDLLYYFPRRYLDRSTIVPMTRLDEHIDKTVTVIGRVTGIVTLGRGRKRLVVTLRDLVGSMDLVFFQGLQYWQKAFTQDETLAVSGVVAMYGRRPNMVHPSIDRLQDEETLEFINTGGIVPVYPSGAELERVGLNRHHGFRRLMHTALQHGLEGIVDPFASDDGAALRARQSLVPLRDAVLHIHRPPSLEQLEQARRRLVFDEFFALLLGIALQRRARAATERGISFRSESPSARALVSSLPFDLTASQRRVLREIAADMARPEPMNRLLQGDVGSGKTVVALLSMLVAVDNGYQCALMVPTEVLAEQHFRTIRALLGNTPVPVCLRVGQQAAAARASIDAAIASGEAAIVVGTHALIEDAVSFNRLGLAVIDEQHRFGVMQRAALRHKGLLPDVLVMSATPIPRTLTMTLYGELDVSVIDELPAGRKNIQTAIRFEEDRAKVHEFIRAEATRGRQAYIVFPLVTESEKIDLKAASTEHARLSSEVFREFSVELLHGQMQAREKEAVMNRFKSGRTQILVSTTVIEVGVDVPNATVMLIEHAERFGLAQLHQLRGRIGRGTEQGYCILMTDRAMLYGSAPNDEERAARSNARRRLETLRDTLDGFRIAEEDFAIRGPGDLWGTAQSGFPPLRIADLLRDGDLLRAARDEAFALVARDPHLRDPAHALLRDMYGARLRLAADASETA